jgi:putative PIN family toxin of toxin-antitoxin system
MKIPKVVVDTNVMVSALLKPESIPGFIWKELIAGGAQAFYSDKMFVEYEEVLHRPKFPFEKETADKILDSITRKFTRIIPETSDIPFNDTSDRPFYETAMTANATLVTGNRKHYPDSPYVASPSEFSIAYINMKLKHAALADAENCPGEAFTVMY